KKYTANFTGNFRFLENKRLGLDFAVFLTQMDNKYAPINATVGSEGNVISQALQWNPTRPLRDAQGNLTFVSSTTRNPLTSIEAFRDLATTDTVIFNVAPYHTITDAQEDRFIYSSMQITLNRESMYPAYLIDPPVLNNEQAYTSNNEENNLPLTPTLSY